MIKKAFSYKTIDFFIFFIKIKRGVSYESNCRKSKTITIEDFTW